MMPGMSETSTNAPIYDAESMGLRDNLGSLIHQARMVLIANIDQEFVEDPDLAAFEVTSAQFGILAFLLKHNVNSACELCHRLDYDRGAMSRMIDRLEAKGLIRRVALAHTRRGAALEVTAEGMAAFPKLEAGVARVLNRLLRGLSKAQVGAAEQVLKRILANA
jgi:DNA-binding MarR family transcriptional regulator